MPSMCDIFFGNEEANFPRSWKFDIPYTYKKASAVCNSQHGVDGNVYKYIHYLTTDIINSWQGEGTQNDHGENRENNDWIGLKWQ